MNCEDWENFFDYEEECQAANDGTHTKNLKLIITIPILTLLILIFVGIKREKIKKVFMDFKENPKEYMMGILVRVKNTCCDYTCCDYITQRINSFRSDPPRLVPRYQATRLLFGHRSEDNISFRARQEASRLIRPFFAERLWHSESALSETRTVEMTSVPQSTPLPTHRRFDLPSTRHPLARLDV